MGGIVNRINAVRPVNPGASGNLTDRNYTENIVMHFHHFAGAALAVWVSYFIIKNCYR